MPTERGPVSVPVADVDPGGDRGSSIPTGSPGDVPSPFRRPGVRLSFALLGGFALVYFLMAILTSAAFGELAAFRVAGLPLGFLLGSVVMVAGLVVTRIALRRGEG